MDKVKALGATFVAISPERPDNSLTTKEKNELTFEVLTDRDNEYGRKIGIVSQISEELQSVYRSFGLDLNAKNNTHRWELPFPATIVIDSDGTVISSDILVDYKQRAEPEDVLKALSAYLKGR